MYNQEANQVGREGSTLGLPGMKIALLLCAHFHVTFCIDFGYEFRSENNDSVWEVLQQTTFRRSHAFDGGGVEFWAFGRCLGKIFPVSLLS